MVPTDLPPVHTQDGTCSIYDTTDTTDTRPTDPDSTCTYSTGYYKYDEYEKDDAVLPEDEYDVELKITSRIAHNNLHRVKEKLNSNKYDFKRHRRKELKCNRY